MKNIIVTLLISVLSIAMAQSSIEKRLNTCSTITNALERLVCFDNLQAELQGETPQFRSIPKPYISDEFDIFDIFIGNISSLEVESSIDLLWVSASDLRASPYKIPKGTQLRIVIRGPSFSTLELVEHSFIMKITDESDNLRTSFEMSGLTVFFEDDKYIVEEPFINTPFFEDFQIFEFYGDKRVELLGVFIPIKQSL